MKRTSTWQRIEIIKINVPLILPKNVAKFSNNKHREDFLLFHPDVKIVFEISFRIIFADSWRVRNNESF